jgi:hypothetical protein
LPAIAFLIASEATLARISMIFLPTASAFFLSAMDSPLIVAYRALYAPWCSHVVNGHEKL